MILMRLARDRWDVLATLSEDSELCPVLEFLLEKRHGQQATRRGMYSFLRETVPVHGPQEDNPEICLRMRPYGDGLWEFRKQPQKGQKVRVLFFRDGSRIICVNGFLKTDVTPQRKLDEAFAVRQRYFVDKSLGDLTIVHLDEE